MHKSRSMTHLASYGLSWHKIHLRKTIAFCFIFLILEQKLTAESLISYQNRNIHKIIQLHTIATKFVAGDEYVFK